MNDTTEQPFIARGKSLLDQLLCIVQTRLEMLSTEIQQEKLALAIQLRLAVIAGVCALLGGFTLIVWIALAFPAESRLIALGAIFALFALVTTVCILMLRRRAQRLPLFARVIQQLRMDRASLGQEP